MAGAGVERSLRRLGTDWIDLYRKGRNLPVSHRAERMPGRYDLADPENQRKLEAAEALAQAGEDASTTMVHLALADAIVPPEVTIARADAGYSLRLWPIPPAGVDSAPPRSVDDRLGADAIQGRSI